MTVALIHDVQITINIKKKYNVIWFSEKLILHKCEETDFWRDNKSSRTFRAEVTGWTLTFDLNVKIKLGTQVEKETWLPCTTMEK